MIIGTVLGIVPYTLLLVGFWPAPGSTASAALFFCFAMIATALGIISLVSATSMIAEIVEAFVGTYRKARRRIVLFGQLAGAEMRYRRGDLSVWPDHRVFAACP